jgi:sporulation protein YlmC with PRC-barrel domain
MRLHLKQLKSLPVRTVSGMLLGRVQDIVVETDGQLVAQYRVKSSVLSTKKYLVGRDQIVRIDAETILVDDAVACETPATKPAKRAPMSPEPIAMRIENRK